MFILHQLSADRSFAVLLNKPLDMTLPAAMDLPRFHGSHADLLLLSATASVAATKHRQRDIAESLLTIIANVSPYVKSLAVVTANKMVAMFATVSAPVFVMAAETNHTLMFYLLDTFNNLVQYQFAGVGVYCC